MIFERLLQILEHVTDKSRSEPFRTYESLGQTACKLAGDLQATRDALAGAAQEQRYTAARLNADCEALHRAIYTELQQLNLGPQVGPLDSTDQELLFPYAQVGFFYAFHSTSWSTDQKTLFFGLLSGFFLLSIVLVMAAGCLGEIKHHVAHNV